MMSRAQVPDEPAPPLLERSAGTQHTCGATLGGVGDAGLSVTLLLAAAIK